MSLMAQDDVQLSQLLDARLRYDNRVTRMQHDVARLAASGHEIIVPKRYMHFLPPVVSILTDPYDLQFVFLRPLRETAGHGDGLQHGDVGLELELPGLCNFSQHVYGVAVQFLYTHRYGRRCRNILFEAIGNTL